MSPTVKTLTPREYKPAPGGLKFAVAIILLLALGMSLMRNLHNIFPAHPWMGSWGITEFMINFEGGFVRRGLLGQLLYELCSATGLSMLDFIYPFSAACYLAVTLAFCYLFHKRGYCWWLPFIMYLCGFWGCFIRKDFLLIGILLLSFAVARHSLNSKRVCEVTLLTVLALFLHEAYIFWGVPLLIMLMARQRRSLLTFTAVSVGVFLLLSLFKGSAQTAADITASWHRLLPDLVPVTPDGTVESLSWTVDFAALRHMEANFVGWYDLTFFRVPKVLMHIIVLICSCYLALNMLLFFRKRTGMYSPQQRVVTFACFVIVYACMLPMFIVLSTDYPRLWQSIFAAVFGCFLLVPVSTILSCLPQWYLRGIDRFVCAFDRILRPNAWATALIMVILAGYAWEWNLVEFMYSSPLLSLMVNRYTYPILIGTPIP
ncbi:MAG: hypothetical protein NC187_02460 [Candidatus Amulumruptor caecigallinarius]|nr:hypothetical protein [Candidatus Amulumruptor caecigallinarius]MCM1396339.1 hypothetical protein [Candidatus Amulumruptor caecigallinarius]MCM1453719.1 hypothetical protein [bacterium]